MEAKYAVGVDVGGSHVCSAVVEVGSGEICSEPRITPIDSHAAAHGIIAALSNNVLGTFEAFGRPVPNIGFAFPGPFDYDRGVSLINGVAKYESIFGLDVNKTLASELYPVAGDARFRFVNDASAFALGEALYGAAKGADKVVALTLGTGVGSGFVADGKLVTDSPDVPANGWVYCLPFEEDDIVDSAFSTRWIVKRYQELSGELVSGAKDVADRFETDSSAQCLFREYGLRLARFSAEVMGRFGSHTLVIGGNISRAWPLFSEAAMKQFERLGFNAEVRVSKLLDKAALAGAASLFK
ncbi:MAG: ROK family protein [Candidatus Cryptobacteroides sp.]